MKKITFALLLAVVYTMTLQAKEVTVNGIMYTLLVDDRAEVLSAKSVGGDVTIPATITDGGKTYKVESIFDEAFDSNENVTSITVEGNNLLYVGDNAFQYCTNLKTVSLPESVISIGEGAFLGSGLETFKMPPVQSMGDGMFEDCYKLKSVELNAKNIKVLPKDTFFSTGLTSITIPKGFTTLGERSIALCSNLTSVSLPNTLTTIGNKVFQSCSRLVKLDFPSSLKTIGDDCFYENNLKTIILPNGLTSMGKNTFNKNNAMELLVLPPSLTQLGDHNFYYFKKLKRAYFKAHVILQQSNSNFTFGDLTQTVFVVPEELEYSYMMNDFWGKYKFGPDMIFDVNLDNEVDIADINLIIDAILGLGNAATVYASDVNEDGVADIADVNLMIDLILDL